MSSMRNIAQYSGKGMRHRKTNRETRLLFPKKYTDDHVSKRKMKIANLWSFTSLSTRFKCRRLLPEKFSHSMELPAAEIVNNGIVISSINTDFPTERFVLMVKYIITVIS